MGVGKNEMQGSQSVVGVLSKVDWRALNRFILNTDYTKALNILASIWQPCWLVHTQCQGKLNATDRDALAVLVLHKAFISFRLNFQETALEEVDLILGVYGWSNLNGLWASMSQLAVSGSTRREVLAPFIADAAPLFPYVWTAPFPVVWGTMNVAAECGDPIQRLSCWLRCFHFFSNVAQSAEFQSQRDGAALWTDANITMGQECALLRATDILLSQHFPHTALDLLNISSGVLRPSMELMKVKLALEAGNHEEAVSILHRVEAGSLDPVCTQVARACVSQSVTRGDSGATFRTLAATFKEQLDDPASAPSTIAAIEFARHCLKNNEAVSLIQEGRFVASFIAMYESLSTFLPIGITGNRKSLLICPDIERVALDTSHPGRVVALPTLFRNAKMLNEFLPLAQARNAMIKELAIARRIEDVVILRDVLGADGPSG
eukprot:Protomagalhaensia_sp_Gyna_25__5881@NODE_889_length_2455_cov_48_439983_g702_i0_p1_GENE_NODE_889_length_2455_cov_48_439983_g702_i0NODE_889_length_2455_cov_48_439983_g702_i0_p1_ORF_typecomplete_len435_score37_63Coatomer_E/PF04733_14/3_2e03Coatomer_E/PF04733_14/0_021PknG_TPR/PF16918_5/0_11ELYS/PF13934_6/0_22_NODE_889_length_2455_cov_48_439983_g702_i011292433